MSTTELLAIAGVILSTGAALAKLANLAEKVNKLERGAEDQGRRIGSLEAELKAIAAVDRVERELSRPYGKKGE